MENIDKILYSLSKSKFRSSFHLKEKDKEYIKDKGMDKIREHAKDFITKRLAPKVINNDGKQTPYKGHPVFISQHATATCCRSCLYKWHKIDMNKALSEEEIDYIVNSDMVYTEKNDYSERQKGKYLVRVLSEGSYDYTCHNQRVQVSRLQIFQTQCDWFQLRHVCTQRPYRNSLGRN